MFNDFNKLRTFIEVANEGSVSKAANKLYRTQSAITQQIQQLEEEIDLPLFDRKNSRIYLTPEGREIYEFAKEKMSQISEQISTLKSDTKSLGGTIKIGVRPDIGLFNLPILIANFRRNFPNVSFQIEYGYAAEIEQMLIDNKIDLGVLLFVKDKKLFEIYPLDKKDVIMVASKKYLESIPKIMKPKDVLKHSLLDFVDDVETRAFAFWAKKVSLEVLAEQRKVKATAICPDNAMMKALIEKHIGIGHLPKYLVEAELIQGSLVQVLPNVAKDYTLSFDLAVRKTRSKALVKEEFLNHFINEMS
ncbi:hypothetical protein A9Q84_00405 [Halobacteriovorax marinus]|uniref:HTH lysR-type domain-containing protein n=1 Tax=Halobacteriovorax marinus TaxID=97084 RepID=A0A1Y5FH48_9BACT|nr:hypothetical protein A9Q84_00405 [Halobacteriovorax marinus]